MSKERATAVSWRRKPMPEATKELLLEGTYTRAEYVTISQGHIPQSPQDKWFIYLEDEWLHFHRSATGTCIFKLHLAPGDDHYLADKAIVNQDPGQYKSISDEYDVTLISYLVDHILLGRFVPFPQPDRLAEDDQQRHRQHVMGQGSAGNDDLTLRMANGRNN